MIEFCRSMLHDIRVLRRDDANAPGERKDYLLQEKCYRMNSLYARVTGIFIAALAASCAMWAMPALLRGAAAPTLFYVSLSALCYVISHDYIILGNKLSERADNFTSEDKQSLMVTASKIFNIFTSAVDNEIQGSEKKALYKDTWLLKEIINLEH